MRQLFPFANRDLTQLARTAGAAHGPVRLLARWRCGSGMWIVHGWNGLRLRWGYGQRRRQSWLLRLIEVASVAVENGAFDSPRDCRCAGDDEAAEDHLNSTTYVNASRQHEEADRRDGDDCDRCRDCSKQRSLNPTEGGRYRNRRRWIDVHWTVLSPRLSP